MDGMFHGVRTQLTSDSPCLDTTDTTYDGEGKVLKQSNPHCSTDTVYWTQNSYDAIGRTLSVLQTDGSTAGSSYSGNISTTTDETGNQRRSTVDALGRLTEVDEPTQSTTGGTQASGSITVNGSEQTSSGPATPGQGSVTISGSEQGPANACPPQYCPIYDTGSVTVVVNGTTVGGAGFGQNDTGSTIASALSAAISGNGNSPVSASLNGIVGRRAHYPIWFGADGRDGPLDHLRFRHRVGHRGWIRSVSLLRQWKHRDHPGCRSGHRVHQRLRYAGHCDFKRGHGDFYKHSNRSRCKLFGIGFFRVNERIQSGLVRREPVEFQSYWRGWGHAWTLDAKHSRNHVVQLRCVGQFEMH